MSICQELDLNNPATFRDLSKPMGAQTEGRLKDFKKRYREWDDPTGETPAYHYATHYSSAMVVASYLVRMEPFAQHFLRLQVGDFALSYPGCCQGSVMHLNSCQNTRKATKLWLGPSQADAQKTY